MCNTLSMYTAVYFFIHLQEHQRYVLKCWQPDILNQRDIFFWNFPVIYLINGGKFYSETYLVKYFYDISLQLIEDN